MPPSELRFAGSLVGQCVGDAVGFMVEGAPAGVCRPYADAVLLRGEIGDRRRGAFEFGQYSDDSQLARALLESLIARRGFDPEDYARRLARLFGEDRIVGGGWATQQAARRLLAGMPWQETGTPPPNAGNGSAMRAGPIGLLFHDAPDRLVAAACDQGRITHADPRCSAGAVAVAGAVALALADGPVEVAPFLGRLAEWASSVEASVAEALTALADCVDAAPEDAVGRIVALSRPDFDEHPDLISPFVTTSVLWSLYAFLRTPDSYVSAIHTAICRGGDVDTTAAMTGAIAGARNGLAALPPRLVERINDRGEWRAASLVALAREAWRVRCG